MSASSRSGAGKAQSDRAYSDILFSLASFSDETVSYGKVELNFALAVKELEKEIAFSKETKQTISIHPYAFEVRQNGIFNLLRLSMNEIIGPVIAMDPRLDLALDDWSALGGYLQDSERDSFLRDLLSEKYKTPPNPVAVKISNKLFQALSKSAPGAPFRFIGESLAAFKRIDKECKKLALEQKSVLTKEQQEFKAVLENIPLKKREQKHLMNLSVQGILSKEEIKSITEFSRALKELKEAIENPENNPEKNKSLIAGMTYLDQEKKRELQKAMKQFIPTAKKSHEQIEKFFCSRLNSKEDRTEDFNICRSMVDAMQKFIKDPSDHENLSTLLINAEELEKIFKKLPQKKIDEHNYMRTYVGMFIGMGLAFLGALLAGPSMGGSIALMAIGIAIFTASAGEPIGLFAYHSHKMNNRITQLDTLRSQASTLLNNLVQNKNLKAATPQSNKPQVSLYPILEIEEQDIVGMAKSRLTRNDYDEQLLETYDKISHLIARIKNSTFNMTPDPAFSFATTHAAYLVAKNEIVKKIHDLNDTDKINEFLDKLQEAFLNDVALVCKPKLIKALKEEHLNINENNAFLKVAKEILKNKKLAPHISDSIPVAFPVAFPVEGTKKDKKKSTQSLFSLKAIKQKKQALQSYFGKLGRKKA